MEKNLLRGEGESGPLLLNVQLLIAFCDTRLTTFGVFFQEDFLVDVDDAFFCFLFLTCFFFVSDSCLNCLVFVSGFYYFFFRICILRGGWWVLVVLLVLSVWYDPPSVVPSYDSKFSVVMVMVIAAVSGCFCSISVM